MGILIVLGSTVMSEGRPLLGAMLCVAAFAAFAGALADPRSAAMAATAIVGVALVVGGRPMEGIGLLVLLAAAAIGNRRHATDDA
jgi:hypothetical protein